MPVEYFQLLLERRFTDAQRVLEQIRQSLGRSENDRGYVRALEGLLLTYTSSDARYLYLNRTQMTRKLAEELRKEFRARVGSELQGSYDKGYFRAMADFMQALMKLRPWTTMKPPKAVSKK